MSQAAFRLEAETAAELAGGALRVDGVVEALDQVDRGKRDSRRVRADARWPVVIVDMIDVQAAALKRLGVADEQAEGYARAMVTAQALYLGGRHIYLPRGKQLEQALRDDEIYRAHRRGNTEALARRYDLTERQVQNIVKRQLELHRARVQMPLFPVDNPGFQQPRNQR